MAWIDKLVGKSPIGPIQQHMQVAMLCAREVIPLLEAMAARLPIATTDVGGNPEVVAHNDSGLLSPRGDAQKLGEHLTRLLGDPALRQTMGAAGHVRLLAQFTQQQMHDGYAKVYDEMLA